MPVFPLQNATILKCPERADGWTAEGWVDGQMPHLSWQDLGTASRFLSADMAFWWGMIHRILSWEGMAVGDVVLPSLASRLVVSHPGQVVHSPFSRFSKVRALLLILDAHFGV